MSTPAAAGATTGATWSPLDAPPVPPELGTVDATGGSSGPGTAVVEVVTALGGSAAVIDRAVPPSGTAHALAAASDAAVVQRAFDALVGQVGPPTALVTAASTDAVGRLEDVDAHARAQVVGVDAARADPRQVARSVVHALRQPVGAERREIVLTVSTEPSRP